VKSGPPLESIAEALRARGLACRGAFHPAARSGPAPALSDGRAAASVVLVGQVGSRMWRQFERERLDEPEPLDAWAGRGLREVASAFGATVVLPQDGPPFAPFLRWAPCADSVSPSPLGLLIHPEYGLWHAYRGALLFADRLELSPPSVRPRPCDSCEARPCLSACPVAAFEATPAGTPARYHADACAAHVASPHGVECRERGCRARRACPVGTRYAYHAARQRFHMAAFLRVAGRTRPVP
jgi:hypothetical protein